MHVRFGGEFTDLLRITYAFQSPPGILGKTRVTFTEGGSLPNYIGKKTKALETDKTKYKFLSTQLATIRYADDFIVLARSRRMIEEVIRPAVENFLSERGLTLSPEKTKVLSIRKSDPIDFLGYTFKYIPRISHKYGLFHDRTGRPGIACYPQTKKVQAIIAKLKAIVNKSINISAYELIAKLNPIIRG